MYHIVTFHELHQVQYLVESDNLDEAIDKIERLGDAIDSKKLSATLVDVSTELSQSDARSLASSLNYSQMKDFHDR